MAVKNDNKDNGHTISNTDFNNVGISISRDSAANAIIAPNIPVTRLIHIVNCI